MPTQQVTPVHWAVAEMSQKIDAFILQHRQEIQSMQAFNKGLMSEMKKLVEYIVGGRETTIVLRTFSRNEARQEILSLFKAAKEPLYYSDIAEQLQMDLEQVLEITTELEREGLIGERKHGSEGNEEKRN
jgi:predicted Rossmann fold nucleotide-binding protein DprA/Smf involved in DNA uptake